jgi:hypothetical protein
MNRRMYLPVVGHCVAVFLINMPTKLMSCDGLSKIQSLLPVKHHVGGTDRCHHRGCINELHRLQMSLWVFSLLPGI